MAFDSLDTNTIVTLHSSAKEHLQLGGCYLHLHIAPRLLMVHEAPSSIERPEQGKEGSRVGSISNNGKTWRLTHVKLLHSGTVQLIKGPTALGCVITPQRPPANREEEFVEKKIFFYNFVERVTYKVVHEDIVHSSKKCKQPKVSNYRKR